MNSGADSEQTIADYYAALRSLDRDLWVSLFADEIRLRNPVGEPVMSGKEGVARFFETMAEQFESVAIHEQFVIAHPLEAAVKWKCFGETANGKEVQFEGIDIFQFDSDGRITRLDGYWDAAPLIDALSSSDE